MKVMSISCKVSSLFNLHCLSLNECQLFLLHRALGRRGGAEYSPWAVAARHLASVSALLGGSPEHAACAGNWTAFVQGKRAFA